LQSYEVVTSAERLAAIAVEVEQRPVTALDFETAGYEPREGEIRLCSLNTGSGRYVIDLFKTKTLGPVKEALNKTNGVIVGQNLKFDQKWALYKLGVEFQRVFDAFRASQVLHNGFTHISHNLYDLMRRELKLMPETQDLGGSDWSGELSQAQYDYAAEDIIHLPAIRESLIPKLKEHGLIKICQTEFQAILPEAAIELNGFYLDAERWRALSEKNIAKAKELRAYLKAELPNPHKQLIFPGFEDLLPQKVGKGDKKTFNKKLFNLDSPEQVLESLRMLGLSQKVFNKETQKDETVPLQDTKEMTLAMLAGKYPIVEKFIEFRGVSQRVKSFGEEYLENIDPKTGRIHTSFWPFTGAGRYSSSKPNLQQIPRDKEFRECFRAEPGRKLGICDYSNIEMRLVAEISGDPLLIKVFNDPKGDAHRTTAALLASVPESEVTKPQRQQAKPVNFGFIYGMQAAKLVLYARANYGVTLSEAQAVKFRRKFFESYNGVGMWHEFVIREAHRRREARTLWGRRRFLDPETAHNEFFNTPVQGSGADGLKAALAIVYRRFKKISGGETLLERGARAAMVHMVHDEIVGDHVEDGQEWEELVKHELQTGMIEGIAPMMKKVATQAEAEAGCDSWADKA
jgi:DNA polymerase I